MTNPVHNEARAVIKAQIEAHQNQIEMLTRKKESLLTEVRSLESSMSVFTRRIGELTETLEMLNQPTTGFAR